MRKVIIAVCSHFLSVHVLHSPVHVMELRLHPTFCDLAANVNLVRADRSVGDLGEVLGDALLERIYIGIGLEGLDGEPGDVGDCFGDSAEDELSLTGKTREGTLGMGMLLLPVGGILIKYSFLK